LRIKGGHIRLFEYGAISRLGDDKLLLAAGNDVRFANLDCSRFSSGALEVSRRNVTESMQPAPATNNIFPRQALNMQISQFVVFDPETI
jgi:hypothetical protein